MMEWVDKMSKFAYFGLLGMLGGVAAYVYMLTTKGGKFSFWLFLGNVFLAFFVGKMVGTWLPDSTYHPEYRDGLVMAAGFCAYPILRILEVRFGEWFFDRFMPNKGE